MTKARLFEQDEKIELMALVLNKLLFSPHKQEFIISGKCHYFYQKENKHPLPTKANLDQGLGFPNPVSLDELPVLWCECGPASPFFASTYTHTHTQLHPFSTTRDGLLQTQR